MSRTAKPVTFVGEFVRGSESEFQAGAFHYCCSLCSFTTKDLFFSSVESYDVSRQRDLFGHAHFVKVVKGVNKVALVTK